MRRRLGRQAVSRPGTGSTALHPTDSPVTSPASSATSTGTATSTSTCSAHSRLVPPRWGQRPGSHPARYPSRGCTPSGSTPATGSSRPSPDSPDLGLLPPHPPRIHFTYLDPDHRAAGGRWHDSATVGDSHDPRVPPRVVVISENKDTAIRFPPVPGGISVEGAGTGGSTPAAIGWLRNCPAVIYWGDIDADGLTILNQYREAGLEVVSILMDTPTYDAYAEFGTNYDAKGNPIKLSVRRDLAKLAASERELYERLTDPACPGYRRVEQERIPLTAAVAALHSAVVAPSRT